MPFTIFPFTQIHCCSVCLFVGIRGSPWRRRAQWSSANFNVCHAGKVIRKFCHLSALASFTEVPVLATRHSGWRSWPALSPEPAIPMSQTVCDTIDLLVTTFCFNFDDSKMWSNRWDPNNLHLVAKLGDLAKCDLYLEWRQVNCHG